jgi:AcrR family transcriptional regulator
VADVPLGTRTVWYDRPVGRGEGSDARERLLEATIEYVSQHGIIDRSLRQLAAEIGTSHRMLVYHFGSKEGLLVEVVRAVEARQLEAMEALAADEGLDPADQFRRMSRRLTDPKLRGNERLFFELYAQALHGSAPASVLLPEVVHAWLAPLTELSVRYGVPPERAADHARLMLAVARGLLLDLVATGERRAIDRAFERFAELSEASLLTHHLTDHANPTS